MIPRDEFAAIVAGSVTAERFRLVDNGFVVADFTTTPYIPPGGSAYQYALDLTEQGTTGRGYLGWNGTATDAMSVQLGTYNGANVRATQLGVSTGPIDANAVLGTYGPSSRYGQVLVNTSDSGSSVTLTAGALSGTATLVVANNTSFPQFNRVEVSQGYLQITVPNGLRIGGWTAASQYTAIENSAGYLLFGATSPADANLYLRSNTGGVNIGGGGGSDELTVASGSVSVTGALVASGNLGIGGFSTLSGGLNVSGQTRIGLGYSPNSSRWDLQNLRLESPGGTTTGLAMWVAAAGIAPVLRCFSGNGESIDCGNNPGTAYAQFGANNFVTWSTARLKKNMIEHPPERVPELVAALRGLRTITFDDLEPEYTMAPTGRFAEVNARWVERGHDPLTPTRPEHVTHVPHDCAVMDCAGSDAEPCGIVRRHRNRRGFRAEDVARFLPAAAALNTSNEPYGIDYSVVTAELWELVAHLLDRVEHLESAA